MEIARNWKDYEILDMSDGEKIRAIKKCYEQAGDETKEIMLEKVKENH